MFSPKRNQYLTWTHVFFVSLRVLGSENVCYQCDENVFLFLRAHYCWIYRKPDQGWVPFCRCTFSSSSEQMISPAINVSMVLLKKIKAHRFSYVVWLWCWKSPPRHNTPTPLHTIGVCCFFLLLPNIIRSVFQLWLERPDEPSILKFKELLFFRNSIFNHIRFFSGGPSRQIDSKVKVTFPSISHIVCNIASAAYQHSPNLTFCADLETFPGCFSTKSCELSLDNISDSPCLLKIWHASWFQQELPLLFILISIPSPPPAHIGAQIYARAFSHDHSPRTG